MKLSICDNHEVRQNIRELSIQNIVQNTFEENIEIVEGYIKS